MVTVYAAVSYVTLELTSIIEDPLGLPEWTLKFLIILLCVGFVLIAILSWVYDFTPEGIKVTQPLSSDSQFQWSGDPSFLVDTSITKSMDGSRFKVRGFLRRFLLPFLAFILIVALINYWDNIFGRAEAKKELARVHVENAKFIIQQHGDLASARKELNLALEVDSQNASAYNTYAVIHLAEKDTAAAKEKLNKA